MEFITTRSNLQTIPNILHIEAKETVMKIYESRKRKGKKRKANKILKINRRKILNVTTVITYQ